MTCDRGVPRPVVVALHQFSGYQPPNLEQSRDLVIAIVQSLARTALQIQNKLTVFQMGGISQVRDMSGYFSLMNRIPGFGTLNAYKVSGLTP